jgi:hypothetical protein
MRNQFNITSRADSARRLCRRRRLMVCGSMAEVDKVVDMILFCLLACRMGSDGIIPYIWKDQ